MGQICYPSIAGSRTATAVSSRSDTPALSTDLQRERENCCLGPPELVQLSSAHALKKTQIWGHLSYLLVTLNKQLHFLEPQFPSLALPIMQVV